MEEDGQSWGGGGDGVSEGWGTGVGGGGEQRRRIDSMEVNAYKQKLGVVL